MRPLNRNPVNKNRSSSQFRNQIGKTKAANMATPMRGGFRF